MEVIRWNEQYVTSPYGPGFSIAFRFTFSFDDEDLMFIVMLMQRSMAIWLDNEMTHGEIRGLVFPSDHDLHGDVLDSIHFDRGRAGRVCMSNKHLGSPESQYQCACSGFQAGMKSDNVLSSVF